MIDLNAKCEVLSITPLSECPALLTVSRLLVLVWGVGDADWTCRAAPPLPLSLVAGVWRVQGPHPLLSTLLTATGRELRVSKRWRAGHRAEVGRISRHTGRPPQPTATRHNTGAEAATGSPARTHPSHGSSSGPCNSSIDP